MNGDFLQVGGDVDNPLQPPEVGSPDVFGQVTQDIGDLLARVVPIFKSPATTAQAPRQTQTNTLILFAIAAVLLLLFLR